MLNDIHHQDWITVVAQKLIDNYVSLGDHITNEEISFSQANLRKITINISSHILLILMKT